jgi:type II secretory pathway component PulL
LRNELDGVELVAAKLDGEALLPQELPAIAIALRGTNKNSTQSFNFRHGALALRSAWVPLRRRLIVAALLLGCTVLISAGAAFVSYAHRSRQAAALQQELTRRYRDLVPGEGTVVDPVMQLRSRMRELQQLSRPGGSDRAHAPLAVLRELSRLIPADLRVDVRDLSWDTDGVRIEGTTTSFETANRLLRSLQQSPLFSAVQLTDAKTSSTGGTINFRLNLIIDTSAQGGL